MNNISFREVMMHRPLTALKTTAIIGAVAFISGGTPNPHLSIVLIAVTMLWIILYGSNQARDELRETGRQLPKHLAWTIHCATLVVLAWITGFEPVIGGIASLMTLLQTLYAWGNLKRWWWSHFVTSGITNPVLRIAIAGLYVPNLDARFCLVSSGVILACMIGTIVTGQKKQGITTDHYVPMPNAMIEFGHFLACLLGMIIGSLSHEPAERLLLWAATVLICWLALHNRAQLSTMKKYGWSAFAVLTILALIVITGRPDIVRAMTGQ